MKPEKAREWRGWCVYWLDGQPSLATLARRRKDSIRLTRDVFVLPWPKLRRRGFSCLPITMTPEKQEDHRG